MNGDVKWGSSHFCGKDRLNQVKGISFFVCGEVLLSVMENESRSVRREEN